MSENDPKAVREIIAGGRTIPIVRIVDGKAVHEEVKLIKIPYLKMDALLRAYGKPLEEMCVYTGKSQEWVESLTDESAADCFEQGRDINDPLFQRFFPRQRDTIKTLGSLLDEDPVLTKALEAAQKDQ